MACAVARGSGRAPPHLLGLLHRDVHVTVEAGEHAAVVDARVQLHLRGERLGIGATPEEGKPARARTTTGRPSALFKKSDGFLRASTCDAILLSKQWGFKGDL